MQSKPGQFQDGAVDLDRRLIAVGRTFAVLWFGIGGALLAAPLFLKPHVWQLRRRLNRVGRKYAIGGLLLSAIGTLASDVPHIRTTFSPNFRAPARQRWLRGDCARCARARAARRGRKTTVTAVAGIAT